MALVKFFIFDDSDVDGFSVEHDPASHEISILGLTAGTSGINTSGNIVMNNNEITGLPDTPGGDSYAASKKYVDSVATGLDPKEEVIVATTGDLTSYVAAGSGVGATLTAPDNGSSHNTIDGITLSLNDRVLVKDFGGGASHADNGIYYVSALGNDTDTSFQLTRATDFDQDSEVTAGATIFVVSGTVNQRHHYVLVTGNPITVDTTALQFGQFGGPGQSHDSLTDVSADDHHNQAHAIDGGDHTLTGATAGHVLRASSGTTFAFAQLAHSDLASVGVNDHHNQAHAIDGGDHTAAGLTSGHVLTATGATTFAFQALPSVDESKQTTFDATADVALAKGDPVFPSANGEVSPCNNLNVNTRKYVGLAQAAASEDAACKIQVDGILEGVTVDGTPAAGDLVYIHTTNGLTVTLPTASGSFRHAVGKMLNTTDIIIEPQYLGKVR